MCDVGGRMVHPLCRSAAPLADYPPLALYALEAYIHYMSLPNLVRVSELARLLGIHRKTATRWVRTMGLATVVAPVRGMPTSQPDGTAPAPNCPAYVSLSEAARLIDAMLPGLANRLERARVRRLLAERTRDARDGASRVRHEVSERG